MTHTSGFVPLHSLTRVRVGKKMCDDVNTSVRTLLQTRWTEWSKYIYIYILEQEFNILRLVEWSLCSCSDEFVKVSVVLCLSDKNVHFI